MLQQKELMAELNEMEQKYRQNKGILEEWKSEFRRLEAEINQLTQTFEQHFAKSELGEQFEQAIREKLENRREGIRLTVKSASRLIRKLNPEKPLEDQTSQFIFKEDLVGDEEVVTAEPEQVVEVGPKVEVKAEVESVQDVELETEAEPELMQELEAKPAAELETITQSVSKLESEQESEPKPEAELEVSTESEEPAENAEDLSETEQVTEIAEVTQPEFNLSAIKEAIQINHEVIEELGHHIEAAEKRFVSFMEKALAPVMDGLFSGKNYGHDLLQEIKDASVETVGDVEEWLGVYRVMLEEIEAVFKNFQIELDSPQAGEVFDEYKHEPIGVVEDLSLEDEQIKSVVRYGLTSKRPIYGMNAYLIRPAQVIVVKNINLPLEDVQEGNQA